MSFLSFLALLALGSLFVYLNSRKKVQKIEQDTVLCDAVIRFHDGSVMRVYEAKACKPSNMVYHHYEVGPNAEAVLSANMEEIKEIEKYQTTLADFGINKSFDEAALIWAKTHAESWRKEHQGVEVDA